MTLVTTVSSSTSGLTPTVSFSSNTAGNTIFVAIARASGSGATPVSGVTDSQGNTYIQVAANTTANTDLWYASNIIGGGTTNTITITMTGTSASDKIYAREYSGALILDKTSNAGNVTSTVASSGSTTTTSNPVELVIGVLGSITSTTVTVGSGYGNFVTSGSGSTNQLSMQDLTTSSTGTQVATFNVNSFVSYSAIVATFAPAPITKTQTAVAKIVTPISTLIDDFPGTTVNSTLWTASGAGTYSIASSQVTFNAGSTIGFTSNLAFSLNNSVIVFDIASLPTTAGRTIRVFNPNGYEFDMNPTSGNINFFMPSGTGGGGSGTSIAYSAVTMRFMRLRVTSGIAYWDTSPDGQTWTNRNSRTPTSTELGYLNNMQVNIGNAPSNTGAVIINAVNIVPTPFAASKTQSSTAHITAKATNTQIATSRIATKLASIQLAKAYILTQSTKNQSATAHITAVVNKNQSSTAHISNVVPKTQSAKSRIAVKLTFTQTVRAYIDVNGQKTQSAKATIIGIATKIQTATASIGKPFTKLQPAISRIAQKYSDTQPAVARIGRTGTKTQPVIAHIRTNPIKTQSAKAHLNGIVTKTQSATAYLLTSQPTPKRYLYKAYDRSGGFLGLLPNVVNDFQFSWDINTSMVYITTKVAVSADTSLLPATQTIDDENGNPITDELGNNLLSEGAINIISTGVGQSLIKNGNKLKVWEFSNYYPNGRLAFSGEMQRIEAAFGVDDEGVSITSYSDGQDMDNYLVQGSPYIGDVSQATSNAHTTITNDPSGTYNYYGQTWTTGAGIVNLGAISLMLNGTADVTVRVFASVPVAPSSTTPVLIGSVTSHVSTATPTEIQFGFATPITVTSSTAYFYDVRVGSGQSIDIYYQNTNPYSGGDMYAANYAGGSGGGGWTVTPIGTIITQSDLYFKTFRSAGATTAVFSSQDPTTGIAESFMGSYNTQGGVVTYTSSTIDPTGLSVPYTFNTSTVFEGLNTVLSLAPYNFYFIVDPGTSVLSFKQTSATADFKLTKGKHLSNFLLVSTIENLENLVYVSGGLLGTGSNLFKVYKDPTSLSLYGQRLARKSDDRVTLDATANAIGTSTIAENSEEQFQTQIRVLDKTMDISLLKPGKTVGFNGFGMFVDTLILQIVHVDYTPEEVTLTVGILPPREDLKTEQAVRDLISLQTVDNPASPS